MLTVCRGFGLSYWLELLNSLLYYLFYFLKVAELRSQCSLCETFYKYLWWEYKFWASKKTYYLWMMWIERKNCPRKFNRCASSWKPYISQSLHHWLRSVGFKAQLYWSVDMSNVDMGPGKNPSSLNLVNTTSDFNKTLEPNISEIQERWLSLHS